MSRILLASYRGYLPTVCRTSKFEFEDVFVSSAGADMVCPVGRPKRFTGSSRHLGERILRKLGLRFSTRHRPMPIDLEGQYDLGLLIAQDMESLDILDGVPQWDKRCRLKAIWLEELWVRQMRWTKMVSRLEEFDLVCCPMRATVEALRARLRTPVLWLPQGVDTLRFSPGPDGPERTTDVCNIGRRGPRTHAALMARMLADPDFNYNFDTANMTLAYDPAEHRELLARRLMRCKYFIANLAKIDSPDQRGDQEELATRFFEGTAAGTVLIGQAPRSASMNELFGWEDAIIPLAYDSPEVLAVIESLDRDPARVRAIRVRNQTQSLRRHDWGYRIDQLLVSLGLERPRALTDRLAELDRRALALESRQGASSSRRISA